MDTINVSIEISPEAALRAGKTRSGVVTAPIPEGLSPEQIEALLSRPVEKGVYRLTPYHGETITPPIVDLTPDEICRALDHYAVLLGAKRDAAALMTAAAVAELSAEWPRRECGDTATAQWHTLTRGIHYTWAEPLADNHHELRRAAWNHLEPPAAALAHPAVRASRERCRVECEAITTANKAAATARAREVLHAERIAALATDISDAAAVPAQATTRLADALTTAAVLGQFLAAHGTDNQRARHAAGVLPLDELLDALREHVFAPLADVPRYEKLRAGDLECDECGEHADDPSFSTCEPKAVSPEAWDTCQTIRQHMPDAVVTFRRHEGEWDCGCREHPLVTAERMAIRVEIALGSLSLSREYAAE